jgi:murein DD-endopeptidase MepM/ murein hydrolase activator NlpD
MARWLQRLWLGGLVGVLVALTSSVPVVAQPVSPDDRPGPAFGPGTPPGWWAGPAGPARSPGPALRRWGWPLEPPPAVVRRFQPSPTPWGAGHRGVDLLARVGQPVLAAGAGVVSFSGVVAGRGVVSVAHPGGLRTTYEPVDWRPALGTAVASGTPIGVVAGTVGHCAPATCLHWGLVSGIGSTGIYLDPLSLLGMAEQPPVLLPLRPP